MHCLGPRCWTLATHSLLAQRAGSATARTGAGCSAVDTQSVSVEEKCRLTRCSARTCNSTRPLRGSRCMPGSANVMWHWLLMLSVASALRSHSSVARNNRAQGLVTLLGVASFTGASLSHGWRALAIAAGTASSWLVGKRCRTVPALRPLPVCVELGWRACRQGW